MSRERNEADAIERRSLQDRIEKAISAKDAEIERLRAALKDIADNPKIDPAVRGWAEGSLVNEQISVSKGTEASGGKSRP